jgi:hypothetical protein
MVGKQSPSSLGCMSDDEVGQIGSAGPGRAVDQLAAERLLADEIDGASLIEGFRDGRAVHCVFDAARW